VTDHGDRSTPAPWCPACLTDVGDRANCPACGLPQREPEAGRARVVVARLGELVRSHEALRAEWAALDTEREALLAALRAGPAPPHGERAGRGPQPAGTSPTPVRWRPERVRDTLLGLGATLLALAALAFAFVAWSRVGDAGRGAILLGFTLVSAAVTVAVRARLRATAEALAALTLALVLVDWYALRRAGVGAGTDGVAWWALGTALVATLGVAAGQRLGLHAARTGAAAAGIASAALAVPAMTGAAWTAAVAAAVAAAAATLAAARAGGLGGWRPAAVLLGAGAVGLDLAAAALALGAVASADPPAPALGPALAVLSVGAAPALGARAWRASGRPGGTGDLLVALAAGSVLAAPVACWAPGRSAGVLAVLAASLGCTAVAAARILPGPVRSGVALAGAVGVGTAVLTVAGDVGRVLTGPHAWFNRPWTGSLRLAADAHTGPAEALWLRHGWAAAGVLLATAAAGLAAGAPGSRPRLLATRPAGVVVVGAAVTAGVVALGSSSLPIGAVLAGEVAAATVLVAAGVALETRRRALVPGLLTGAVLAGVPAAGWAAVTPTAAVTALAAVIVTTGAAGLAARDENLRVGLRVAAALAAVAQAAVVVAALERRPGPVGVAVTLAAGVVLVVGALLRRHAPEGASLEVAAVAALAVGLAYATATTGHLAAALTLTTAALGVAGRRAGRPYVAAATLGVVASTWAWLVTADVSLLEAYTLPAAAVLLATGARQRRSHPSVGSWIAYGPGCALALGPSLVVALPDDGVLRPLTLTAGGLIAVTLGARSRLGAPLVLGGATLVTLALDALGPVAWRAPRWVLLGTAGALLLWLGASAERRLEQLRRWQAAARSLR
jgi:hypothetical protein